MQIARSNRSFRVSSGSLRDRAVEAIYDCVPEPALKYRTSSTNRFQRISWKMEQCRRFTRTLTRDQQEAIVVVWDLRLVDDVWNIVESILEARRG